MNIRDLPLGEVRPAHRFDEGRLHAWLAQRIAGFGDDMRVLQFAGGASNPTFLLTTVADGGERHFVLRKKPPGVLLPSAHQVDREYRAMRALAGSGVPVPVARAYCDDPAVIGTEFYVMDFLEGRVFRDATLPDQTPEERAAIYDSLNDALARLHAVDYNAVGLGDFGRAGGFFGRQLKRWSTQYRKAQTEDIPAMERLLEELPARLPADDVSTIAHGDYRLGNVMFHPTEPRVIAVLDWELATIGHPLADLGYNCFMWHTESAELGSLRGVDFAASGIPTEQQYVEAYCRRTGRDGIADWNFYLAFAAFRLAAITQGVYRRALDGNISTERGELVNGAGAMAELALRLLHRPA
ncbi:phosphotransferase family protein [Camelimonas abortus]|uniref:Phosphotransferase family protein n=1 Tax=Camelimonas abortus TaxID=1017184 RepID=A0ABV7LEC8_9HYPH